MCDCPTVACTTVLHLGDDWGKIENSYDMSIQNFKYYVNSVHVDYECKKRLFPADTITQKRSYLNDFEA